MYEASDQFCSTKGLEREKDHIWVEAWKEGEDKWSSVEQSRSQVSWSWDGSPWLVWAAHSSQRCIWLGRWGQNGKVGGRKGIGLCRSLEKTFGHVIWSELHFNRVTLGSVRVNWGCNVGRRSRGWDPVRLLQWCRKSGHLNSGEGDRKCKVLRFRMKSEGRELAKDLLMDQISPVGRKQR